MSQPAYYGSGQQQPLPSGPGQAPYGQYPPQQQQQQYQQQSQHQQAPPPQGQYGAGGFPPIPAQNQYHPPAAGQQYPPGPQPPHELYGGHSPQPPPQQQYGGYAPPPGAQQPPPQQPPNSQYGQYPPQAQQQQSGPYGQHQQQYPPATGQPGQYSGPPAGGQYGQPQGQYAQPQGQYPPQQQQPPQGQYAQYPPQNVPYGQQQQPGYPAPQVYPPQGQYGAPAPGQYGSGYKYSKPASFGYDVTRRATAAGLNTSPDVEALRKAMKGMGCDERALIRVLTKREYANPFAMRQLVEDYNKRFLRDLAKDIESETRGDFETALLALIRGPLELDARVLNKALVCAGTDEEAIMDVLLSRSNADISAIVAEYRRLFGHELLADIKDDVDDEMYRLWSMVLSATRHEDPDETTPISPHREDIRSKTVELQHATEGTGNAIAVARILTSSSDAQIRAVADAFRTNYKATLEDVIEREFRGDMEDALLRMLTNAQDRARADARRLESPLYKAPRKDRLFINRLVGLYWDQPRMHAAVAAFSKHSKARIPLRSAVKVILSSDYEDVVVALLEPKI